MVLLVKSVVMTGECECECKKSNNERCDESIGI